MAQTDGKNRLTNGLDGRISKHGDGIESREMVVCTSGCSEVCGHALVGCLRAYSGVGDVALLAFRGLRVAVFLRRDVQCLVRRL